MGVLFWGVWGFVVWCWFGFFLFVVLVVVVFFWCVFFWVFGFFGDLAFAAYGGPDLCSPSGRFVFFWRVGNRRSWRFSFPSLFDRYRQARFDPRLLTGACVFNVDGRRSVVAVFPATDCLPPTSSCVVSFLDRGLICF